MYWYKEHVNTVYLILGVRHEYPLLSRSAVPACPLVNREDTAAGSKEEIQF